MKTELFDTLYHLDNQHQQIDLPGVSALANNNLFTHTPANTAIRLVTTPSRGGVVQTGIAIAFSLSLTSCAMTPGSITGVEATSTIPAAGEKYKVEGSYLTNTETKTQNDQQQSDNGSNMGDNSPTSVAELLEDDKLKTQSTNQVEVLKALPRGNNSVSNKQVGNQFSELESLSVAVNDMNMKSFLNYVFGELLAIDYVISKDVPNDKMTLNVSNKVSPRKLFEMTQQVLMRQGIGIRFADGIYYIYDVPKGQKTSVVMGFGRQIDSVPQSAGNILQVVPLKYGVRGNVQSTVGSLIEAQISVDFEQGVLFIQGEREQIVRGLELINLLDVPSNSGKYISLISPTFLSVDELIASVTQLLQTEGINVADKGRNNGSVLFVPLPQLGAVTVFSAEKDLLARVEYWVRQIDKPSMGTERQYHIYTPRFARASDLGESIAPLISGSSSTGKSNKASDSSSKDSKDSSVVANNPTTPTSSVSSNENMTMVVDDRSNSLIFHSSGREYQSILPLVRRMDILPKQVLLNVTIAEVKLSGEFKRGFEFAIKSGNVGASTKGALDLSKVGGIGLSWANAGSEVLANFIDGNSQVNILSKPSLLVRDGTEASINVGDKIPVSSGTSTSGSGEVVTENISYRETGIKLTVTPTVNAQGVVIMLINQDISNQLADQAGKGDNPIFFERSIQTEVVADSGQTILLGGLISEDSSNSSTGVPWLKAIPLIGGLFESESKTNAKTELVIMVTPKIVERSSQWNSILGEFQKALNNIDLQQQD
ncbi:secretin N-terminal domain-containing protein [Shewanella frigidimarina]|uniref:Type II/III secretion system secretin-like domain-containing protein n=1 Tax=Shewanella frigidimarina TaxID=56812 RepID=A0A106C3E1_SHEFR|nr:secretin N-terminal domain-containing protein [Shewanella frigidimarina]KVX03513.1 hypothetical protein AWJ07_02855 [Shewanella frigidimarina]